MTKPFNLVWIVLILLPLKIFAFSAHSWVATINNIKNEEDLNHNNSALNKFRRDYKLLFVYSSTCKYCHKFSKILEIFVNQAKIDITAITSNGGQIAPFVNALYDLEKISRLGVSSFPTLFAEHKSSKQTYLINQGAVSLDELTQNFNTLLYYLYES